MDKLYTAHDVEDFIYHAIRTNSGGYLKVFNDNKWSMHVRFCAEDSTVIFDVTHYQLCERGNVGECRFTLAPCKHKDRGPLSYIANINKMLSDTKLTIVPDGPMVSLDTNVLEKAISVMQALFASKRINTWLINNYKDSIEQASEKLRKQHEESNKQIEPKKLTIWSKFLNIIRN